MAIRASQTSEIRALIHSLGADAEIDRDVAVARLAVIGVRAVDRLIAMYGTSGRLARVGILRALERIGDPRTIPIAREALHEGGDLAVAAAAALKPLLESTDSRAATAALDALVEAALNASAERRVRLSAFEALADMPADVRDPIAAALQQDPGAASLMQGSAPTEATWQDAVDGRLPDDPAALREALQVHGERAPLSTLQKLVDAVRARENETLSGREAWREVRGAIHQALALRESRVAVYDLRETLAAAREPLPATFVAALHAVGDESCLEPIGAAWAAADADETWRQQLAAAFAAIVKREKITRRSAIFRRISTRWRGIM